MLAGEPDKLAAVLGYYTSLANAGEAAGLGVCVAFYTTTDAKGAPEDLLATVHTGAD